MFIDKMFKYNTLFLLFIFLSLNIITSCERNDIFGPLRNNETGTETESGTGTEIEEPEPATPWSLIFDGNSDNDIAYSVAIDSNDNIYLVGYGSNLAGSATGNDWWIKKFSSDGIEDTTNWNKIFDGNSGYDYAYSVAIDSSDNVYVAGSGYNLAGSSTLYDWWIKKFSSDGTEDTVNWDKIMDGNSFSDNARSVAIDSSDNVYVAGDGAYLAGSATNMDWWIQKFVE